MSWIICKAEVVTKVKSKRHLKSYKIEIRTDLKLTMDSEKTKFRYRLFTLERTFCQSKKIYFVNKFTVWDVIFWNSMAECQSQSTGVTETQVINEEAEVFFYFFVKWWYKLTGIEMGTDGAVGIWTQLPEFSSIFQRI